MTHVVKKPAGECDVTAQAASVCNPTFIQSENRSLLTPVVVDQTKLFPVVTSDTVLFHIHALTVRGGA